MNKPALCGWCAEMQFKSGLSLCSLRRPEFPDAVACDFFRPEPAIMRPDSAEFGTETPVARAQSEN